MTTAALGFGALEIKLEAPLFGILDPGEPWIAALADGADWGTPEAVVATVASMLMDGDKSQITRFGNRIAVLPLRITGENLDVVSAGEALVMAEVNKGRNVFNWTPPGPAETSVFDVVYSKLDFKFDDLAEVNQVTRYFTLTMECMPSARRAGLTSVVAEPIPTADPSHDVVDACDSLTGWAAAAGSMSTSGGSVSNAPAHVYGLFGTTKYYWRSTFARSGLSTVVDDGEYVVVDIEAVANVAYAMTLRVSGGAAMTTDAVATETVSANRKRWYYSPEDAAVLTAVEFDLISAATGPSVDPVVYEIYKTDQLPFSGTRRQRSFTALVGGTARTPADLRVALSDDAVSARDFLLYTAPLGAAIAPPMRQWLSSSASITTDSTLVSGAYQSTGTTPSVYEIPVASIPTGSHSIMARLRRTSASGPMTLNWDVTTDAHYASGAGDASGATVVDLTTNWSIHEIGIVNLPPIDAPGNPIANVVLSILGSANALVLDELWLFNLDSGVLTWLTDLDVGTGTPRAYEVRSADLDSPRPSWLVGSTTDDRMISVADRATSAGVHVFAPGLISIFLVTPGDEAATATVTYHERFPHHVTRLES